MTREERMAAAEIINRALALSLWAIEEGGIEPRGADPDYRPTFSDLRTGLKALLDGDRELARIFISCAWADQPSAGSGARGLVRSSVLGFGAAGVAGKLAVAEEERGDCDGGS